MHPKCIYIRFDSATAWLFVFMLAASSAEAWWDTGHSFITQNSVAHLPSTLQTFVNREYSTILNYASIEPPGRHYIDIDLYSEFFAGQMPRDLSVLDNAYGATLVDSRGISPWVIANYRATLTAQMSSARELADLATVARTAGEMAHYLEDINQPLHTTYNYDGQYTRNSGIHARYEGTLINLHFGDLSIVPTPQNCVYVTDTVDWVLDTIETRTWSYVDDIMAADTLARQAGDTSSQAYYNSLWNSVGGFTYSQFQSASEMVASAWYSAWTDAGSPALSIAGDYNNDGNIDLADYVVWKANLGTATALPNDATMGVSLADYNDWRNHFGQSVFSFGTAVGNAIPEPTVFSAIAVGLCVLALRNSRQRKADKTSLFLSR